MNQTPQIHPHPGEQVYSSCSPENTRKTSGRSCGISLYRSLEGGSWTLVFRYNKSEYFTTPEEVDVQDSLEIPTLGSATSEVLKYDMPAHFKIDFSVVSHCALIGTVVGIHDHLLAAWGREIAKFTEAVAENHWEWDKLGKS